MKDRFCPEHKNDAQKCCVVGCTSKASKGFRTCDATSCRPLELFRSLQNKAMFQLTRRYQGYSAQNQHRKKDQKQKSILEENTNRGDDEDLEITERGDVRAIPVEDNVEDDTLTKQLFQQCGGKDGRGNVRRKARFGRRWTHNEELVVASCGVILARATFFGSEAPNGVKVLN
jgi:CxC6 like cysteine cluster associated with KDZ transposases